MGDSGDERERGTWGNIAAVSSLGIHLVLSITVGVGAGYFLDRWLHTAPVFLFGLFLFGIFVGGRQVVREMRKLSESDR
jgi:F0F1-type ATP synthase assembly protein I